MEIWNVVFSQFNNDGHGNYTDLVQKNIDTGMGLERLAVAVQDVDSIFDVDTLRALRDHVCEMAGVKYHSDDAIDVSIRIITDHIRSATFMISDGIMPSNEGRGYVLRRIIRRAARQGRKLGIKGTFLAKLSATVIDGSKDGYPELDTKKEFIFNVLTQEENQFNKTLDQGLSKLEDLENELKNSGKKILDGEDAFRLYDTFGFPVDLTKEILEEKGFEVDEDGFAACMKKQKETARKARKVSNYMGADATVYDDIDASITSKFIGYDKLICESTASVLTSETDIVEALADGDKGTIFTDETTFYATMGGQEGDKGMIRTAGGGEFRVTEAIHLLGGKIGHIGVMTKGMIKKGDTVTLEVDSECRNATCRNHSATHLLQKSLRTVLGDHVEQAGAYYDSERLRFDFSHFQNMTSEEISKVEKMVNDEIKKGYSVDTEVMPIEEARKTGAMALFGEKYGDKVRVVEMGGFSKEFCGGTHVKNVGEIGSFKILSESSAAAGVRRIEAITGDNVLKYYQTLEDEMNKAAAIVKAEPRELADKCEHLLEEIKKLKSENESLKSKAAQEAAGDAADNVQDVNGVKFLSASVKDVDMNGLRELGDNFKAKLGEGVVVLASEKDGKANLVAMATDGAVAKGAHAGNLIKGIAGLIGGGGGGRPNSSQAGGKNPAGIPEALKKAGEILKDQIK